MSLAMLGLRRFFGIICLTLALAPLAVGASSFLTAIEDVPLAPGLTERTVGGMVFDSPIGRIVEAVASGTLSADQISHFYAATLPQLGWSEAGNMTFKRDSEILRISIEPALRTDAAEKSVPENSVIVRFNLTPNH